MKIHLLLYILLSLCTSYTLANHNREDEYLFSKIDYQQGLSNSAVMSVFQDNSGLMWFGTYDGVNCYDGKSMDVYRADSITGLSNNVIYRIQQADKNCLWITTGGGLDRFSTLERKVVKHYTIADDYSLHSNSNGNTWLVGHEWIAYYNTKMERFIRIECPQAKLDNLLTQAFVANDGKLWLFSQIATGETYQFSLDSFSQDTLKTNLHVSSSSFHAKPIKYVYYQNDIFCFVDADMDVYMYNISFKSKIYIRNIATLVQKYGEIKGIVPFYEDIFIAFWTNGLIRLRTPQKYIEEVVDRNLRIFDVHKDAKQGILWVGSDGQGALMYAKRYSIASNLMLRSLSPNLSRQVRSLMTDKYNGLWFGTKGDGLLHIPDYQEGVIKEKVKVYFPDFSQHVVNYAKGHQEFQVYALQQSYYRNGFWVGSGGHGLLFYSFDDDALHYVTEPAEHRSIDIHAIREENDTTLYLATAGSGFKKVILENRNGELQIKRQQTYNFYHEGHAVSMFFSMIAEGDSVLWLGSRECGVVRFNKHTEEYQVISLESLVHQAVDDVLCMLRFPDGKFYIGTTSGLVCLRYCNGHAEAEYIGREQGLLNDMIHGLLKDANDFLWLSTNRGLIKYNPKNQSSHTYYYTGGVQIGEFSDDAYYKCPYTGNLFFGGIDGLLYMGQERVIVPEYFPNVVLRKLYIGNIEANLADFLSKDRKTLCLKETDSSFTLKFIAPDYINGADVEYSYMLEGYDNTWTPFSSKTEATYIQIPAGDYTFQVRYKKDVFDTDYKLFAIPIHISTVWYCTPTAFTIYSLLALIALCYAFYRQKRHSRNKHLKQTEKEDYAEYAKQTHHNKDIIHSFVSLYQICNELTEEMPYEKRSRILDTMRENLTTLVSTSHTLTEEEKKELFKQEVEIIKQAEGLSALGSLAGQFVCHTTEQVKFIKRILIIIEQNLDKEDLGTTFIAEKMAMSPRHFYRKFKEISGIPPGDLIKNYRMEKAARLLKEGKLSIQDIIAEVGIGSRSYFYREFTRKYNMTPKDYRDSQIS